MSDTDKKIVGHYQLGDLFEQITNGLRDMGKTMSALVPEDLKPVDEFHIGGFEATKALLDQLKIDKTTDVLDIGCGLGGTARFITAQYGSAVTGIDLTPDFVETAKKLSAALGMKASFSVGSALDLPFKEESFDLVTLFHVGMNLPDKPKLFSEVARVLRPGGKFAVYDVMQTGDQLPAFPVPWASDKSQSFVEKPEAYVAAATAAGLTLDTQRERSGFAVEFFEKQMAQIKNMTKMPFGLPMLMGKDAAEKIGNMKNAVGAGQVAPIEMIFTKPMA